MEKISQILRQSLNDAHETLEGTMDGVTEDVAHFVPVGKAIPIGALYAHVIISEDQLIQTWLQKKKLLQEKWENKPGISIPMPLPGADDWENVYTQWVKDVRIDLPELKKYAQAVYAQSDAYLGSLTDTDVLDKTIDMSAMQLGQWPVARFIVRFVISHVDSICGEISALKGIQGLKGYPF